MNMIQSRNLTSHTYNEETAVQIATSIRKNYINDFRALLLKLEELLDENSS